MLEELIAGLRADETGPALLGRGGATRAELGRLADGYAAALHARGLTAGETIGLAVLPGVRSFAVILAAYRLGLRIAVLDPGAGPEVLLARLALAQPRLVLADAAAQAVAGWAAPLARRAQLALPDLAAIAPVVTIGRRLPGSAPRLEPKPGQAPVYDGDGDLVGDLLPGMSARVDDTGQLMLSGPNAADRYLGEEPMQWVATGDIGRVDGSTVVLGGRSKDMILRDAENIYPGLYEPALHVPGVELAVIVGVPAGDGDERVVAVVQPAAGVPVEQIRAALRGPLDRMGWARPDAVVFAEVPLSGRSRKPDRAAAARLAGERS